MARDVALEKQGAFIGDAKIRLIRSRVNNPERVLKQIGAILVSTSQKSFRDQSFGNLQWKPQYPTSKGQFVHVAGVVQDLTEGSTIKARRFQRNPANIGQGGRGGLSGSIAFQMVGKNAVEVGTSKSYGKRIQTGGVSTQPVSSRVKKGLAKFAKKKSSKSKRGQRIMQRVGFLFRTDRLRTIVNPRPYLGITPDAQKKIIRIIEQDLPK